MAGCGGKENGNANLSPSGSAAKAPVPLLALRRLAPTTPAPPPSAAAAAPSDSPRTPGGQGIPFAVPSAPRGPRMLAPAPGRSLPAAAAAPCWQ